MYRMGQEMWATSIGALTKGSLRGQFKKSCPGRFCCPINMKWRFWAFKCGPILKGTQVGFPFGPAISGSPGLVGYHFLFSPHLWWALYSTVYGPTIWNLNYSWHWEWGCEEDDTNEPKLGSKTEENTILIEAD